MKNNIILFTIIVIILFLPIINTIINTEMVYSDENYYKLLSNEIKSGNTIPRYMPGLDDADIYKIFRSPLYPLIVSFLDKWVSLIFSGAILAFCILFYRRHISEKKYPFLVIFTIFTIPMLSIMTMLNFMETYFTFFILISTYFLVRAMDDNKILYSVISGFACMMLILGKELGLSVMVVLPLSISILILYREKSIRKSIPNIIRIIIPFSIMCLIGCSYFLTNIPVFGTWLPHEIKTTSMEFSSVDSVQFFQMLEYPDVFFSPSMILSTIGIGSLIIFLSIILYLKSKNKDLHQKNNNLQNKMLFCILMWTLSVFIFSQWRYVIPIMIVLVLAFVPYLSERLSIKNKRTKIINIILIILISLCLLYHYGIAFDVQNNKIDHYNQYVYMNSFLPATNSTLIATEALEVVNILDRNVTWIVWYYFNEETLNKIDVDYIYINLPMTANRLMDFDHKIDIIIKRNDTQLLFNNTDENRYNMLFKVDHGK